MAAKLPRVWWVQWQLPGAGPSTATPAEDPGVEAEEGVAPGLTTPVMDQLPQGHPGSMVSQQP